MTDQTKSPKNPKPGREDARAPYVKPEIRRVDLALEETMSGGCKLAGTECTEPFPGISLGGS